MSDEVVRLAERRAAVSAEASLEVVEMLEDVQQWAEARKVAACGVVVVDGDGTILVRQYRGGRWSDLVAGVATLQHLLMEDA